MEQIHPLFLKREKRKETSKKKGGGGKRGLISFIPPPPSPPFPHLILNIKENQLPISHTHKLLQDRIRITYGKTKVLFFVRYILRSPFRLDILRYPMMGILCYNYLSMLISNEERIFLFGRLFFLVPSPKGGWVVGGEWFISWASM